MRNDPPRRFRAAPLGIVLLPSLALAQASAAGNTGTPLLWLWVLVAIAVIAAMVALLFVTPRGRARAHGWSGRGGRSGAGREPGRRRGGAVQGARDPAGGPVQS